MRDGADVIVVGAGLAGLVATAELADAGRRVILLEQEPAPWLGGQAFWSFGGLFLVSSPGQGRLGGRASLRRVREAAARGLVTIKFRHRVDALMLSGGAVDGVQGAVLEPSAVDRGRPSSRLRVGEFEFQANAVIVTSGGLGGNHELVRTNWPARLGAPPQQMLSGVPAHVDGRMLAITEHAGGAFINRDRMWHYVEGVQNWSPIWPDHGIRILPGPSSMWFDALGNRLPAPLFPGFDTLGTLEHLRRTGFDYSWFVLTQRIIKREFALSGSEQNPDLTNKDVRLLLQRVISKSGPAPVEAFKERGADFVVSSNLGDLVRRMNALSGEPRLDPARMEREIAARDREVGNGMTPDQQILAIRAARRYLGDRLIRVATPHRLLDPAAGPLVGVP